MLKLREIQPAKVLTLFCDLLDRYLGLSCYIPIDEEKLCQDHSYNWLPNLESEASSWDGRNSVARILARAIWAITKQILEQDSSKVEILFGQLQGYRWQIFDRISLQLLRQFPMHFPNFIIHRLTDRHRFERLALNSIVVRVDDCHEHALLLKEQFSNLPDNAQKQIFDLLLEDPIDVMKIAQYFWIPLNQYLAKQGDEKSQLVISKLGRGRMASLPGSKLSVIASIFNLDTSNAHDALGDITMMKDVFFNMIDELKQYEDFNLPYNTRIDRISLDKRTKETEKKQVQKTNLRDRKFRKKYRKE
jgi:hypothetical protein